MAQRRMFNSQITESTGFLQMPFASQVLYFRLGMHADEDGFISNVKVREILGIPRTSHDDYNDYRLLIIAKQFLIAKQFILELDDGIIINCGEDVYSEQ